MNQKFYLNFREDTGQVWKLTNILDSSSPYMEIDRETMIEFAEERKRLDDYIVIPSTTGKGSFELKFKHYTIESFNVDRSIHKFPKGPISEDLVLNVIQNTNKGKWYVSLSENLKALLSSTSYYKNKNHMLFVTDQDDPNILLDTLQVSFNDILNQDRTEVKNTNKKIAQRNDVSVYCGKVFDNYSHIVES